MSRYRESAGFRFSNNLECSLEATKTVEERKLTEFSNNIIKLLRTNFPYLRFWLNCESIINSWQAGFCTTLNAICGFVFSKLYIFLVVFQCIYGGHTIFFSNRKFDVPLFVAVMPIISAPAVHDSKQPHFIGNRIFVLCRITNKKCIKYFNVKSIFPFR